MHRAVPNHRVAHFRGSRQITGSRISQGRVKSQHSIISRKVCRSQQSVISRKLADHSIASFHGKSADHSGAISILHCYYTLTLHILHNLHCFHFSVSIFFVNFRTFFFSKDSILESNRQTDRQTNKLMLPIAKTTFISFCFFRT